MPKHRQPTPAARRARPALVTVGALTLLCTATGVALAATNPAPEAVSTPTAATTPSADTAREPTTTTTAANPATTDTSTADEPSTTSSPSSDGESWLSGASGDGAADGALGEWRGDPVDIVGTWADVGDNQTQLYSIAPGGEVADFDGAIDIAPGGLQDGDTWAAAADGAYDDRWRESLTRMAELRAGLGTTFVRPFHEFNLAGWAWSVDPGDAEDFKAAWVRYRAIQQEIFPEAQLVYGVNVTSSGTDLDWRTTWPGRGQADVLGVDTYNGWPTITSAADFQAQLDARGDNGVPIGLNAYTEQAAEWGVPLAVPEWSGRAEMGDEPAYVKGMVDWFAANAGDGPGQLAYEVLFNAPQDDGNFQLFADDTRMPASAAAYVAAIDATADETAEPPASADAEPSSSNAGESPTRTAGAVTSPTAAPQRQDQADAADRADIDELLARVDALLARLEQS